MADKNFKVKLGLEVGNNTVNHIVANASGITTTGFANVASTFNANGAATLGSSLVVTGGTTLKNFLLVTPDSGSAGITITGNVGNPFVEMGLTNGNTSTPFIDFHSGATSVDYDARIIASGGTGAIGGGKLQLGAANVEIQGSENVTGILAVTGATTLSNTLATGNTTVTGFANVTTTLQSGNATHTGTLATGNTTVTGFANVTTTLQVGGATTIAGKLSLTGNASAASFVLNNGLETANVSATAATGTMQYFLNEASVKYFTTNASANFNANVAWSSGTTLNTAMGTGQAVTLAWLVTQGASAFFSNTIYIDGVQVTPKWSGGAAPTAGNASGIDAYVFTIIKTGASTYTVLGTQTQYK